jgi:hypothetical protein
MPTLASFTQPLTLLREHLTTRGVLLTEASLPVSQLSTDEPTPAAGTPAPSSPPALAVPITSPTDLQPGDPFTGQTPVLVSQDFQAIDQAGARALAAAQAGGGGQITCLLLHLPTKAAIALLNQLQERGELDQQLAQGQVDLPQVLTPTAEVVGDFASGPASLALFGRLDAENGARVGDLYHTKQLPYHTQGFQVDFENLLTVPAHLLTDERTPASVVYEEWNKGVDVARAARNVSLHREEYLRQAVIRQARQKGYDGIRYGDEWVQLISQ